jgi:NAD(P) transhydrogenase subunit alpha
MPSSVEAGAGAAASFDDAAYAAAGATIGDAASVWGADIVAKINAPTDAEIAMLRPARSSSA